MFADAQPALVAIGAGSVANTNWYSYGAVPSWAAAEIIPNSLQFSFLETNADTLKSIADSVILNGMVATPHPAFGRIVP